MNNDSINEEDPNQRITRRSHREISRAVAEREASRLARPERSVATSKVSIKKKNDNKLQLIRKSIVSSTPLGRNYSTNRTSKEENDAWCGPFSIARQMIAAREEARRRREENEIENAEEGEEEEKADNNEEKNDDDNIDILQGFADDIHFEMKTKQHPSLNWKGNQSTIEEASKYKSTYVKRRKRYEMLKTSTNSSKKRVSSLLQMCLHVLADNFDHVESLGYGVDSTTRKLICETLIAKGRLNGAAFDVLTEDGIESLEIADCAVITQIQLCEAFDRLVPQGLRAILLEYAGRCFGPSAVSTLVNHKDVCSIFAISIGGAYLLDDTSVSNLISSLSSSLSSIEFRACPLLGEGFCTSIASSYNLSSQTTPLLELLMEDLVLSKDQLLLLNAASSSSTGNGGHALSNLRQLKLSRISAVDDEVLQSLLSTTNSLQSLILHDLENITDVSLVQIRNRNTEDTLRVLHLSSLKSLTDIGLELLFAKDIIQNTKSENNEDLTYDITTPSPPRLTRLDLSDNGNDVVTDNVMSLVLQAYGTTQNNELSNAYTRPSKTVLRGLTYLNLTNTTSITDNTMEQLSSTTCCQTSLQELNISFCPKISDRGLGYLVSQTGDQLRKLSIWGCAQITDEFLDGHNRVNKRSEVDEGLEVVGAWMKKRKL